MLWSHIEFWPLKIATSSSRIYYLRSDRILQFKQGPQEPEKLSSLKSLLKQKQKNNTGMCH